MTGREKAIAILEGEMPDTPALYACITSDALVENLTGEKLVRETGLDVLARAYRGHIDSVRIIFDTIEPYWEEGEHVDEGGFVRRTERWTEWCVKRPFGNVQEHAAFIGKEIETFRAYDPGEEEARWTAHADSMREVLGPQVLLMGRFQGGTAPGSYFRDGLDNFSYLLAEHPPLVQEWLEARHQRTLKRIGALVDPEKSPVEFIDADLAFKTGLLVSPDYLRATGWFGRVAEIVDVFHACGVKLIFHSDGDLREILPELAATGIDGLNPIETSAGMTLKEVRKFVGDRLLLVGGIPNDVLINGSPEDVRACVRELKRDMAGTPWWAGTSTEEFDSSMAVENIRVVMEETGHAL